MSRDEYTTFILKEKIAEFRKQINHAAEKLDIQLPAVKIWSCPEGTGREIAHCHHQSKTICISEGMLLSLSIEEIKKTAYHEVSHLLHPDHGFHFKETNDFLVNSSWEPPKGVGITVISEKDLNKINKISQKAEKDTENCNFYQSEKHQIDKVRMCKYCQRYFCKDHLKPGPVSIPSLTSENFTKESTMSQSTHPCMNYYTFLEEKKNKVRQKKVKEIQEIFNKNKEKIKENEILEDKTYNNQLGDNKKEKSTKKEGKIGKKLKRFFGF